MRCLQLLFVSSLVSTLAVLAPAQDAPAKHAITMTTPAIHSHITSGLMNTDTSVLPFSSRLVSTA